MDDKKVEILSNMRFIPLVEDLGDMYETIVNYARELVGARRVVFYVKNEEWEMEFSYPSQEMLGFELEGPLLEEAYEKFSPYALPPEKAKELGINIEGTTIFFPLGTKDCRVGVLVLVGAKLLPEEVEEEKSVLRIFSHYLELYIHATKKILEKRDSGSEGDEFLSTLKKDLISMISRNLRTPLASILAYAETLKESENLSEKERIEFINTVYEKSRELKEAMDSMMDYVSMLMEE